MRMLDEPGGGYRLLPGRRIVAFYGEADAPELGVLGDAPPGVLWKRLAAQASVYDRPGVPAIPSYELIAFAAQASAGPGDLYTARISDSVISSYLRVVQAHHGLLILDIQPGRSDFLADAKTLAHWLAFPDVALALDPEWVLRPGQLPLAQIGSTTAAVVNQVSAWLEALVVRQELPQKLLIIHDFTPTMVVHESGVALEAHLAIVFNMDGFGAQPNKVAAYEQLAEDHHYYFGFKLFLTRDIDMFTPAEVMGLKPSPSVIEYE